MSINVKLKTFPELAKNAKLPTLFNGINERALQIKTEDTESISRLLRQELYSSVVEDLSYKEKRFPSFLSCCRDYLDSSSNDELPRDMESFR